MTESGNKSMGERISDLLEKQELTQRELAEKAGITDVRMSRICRNESNPDAEQLMRIAKALGTTMEYLMGDDSWGDELGLTPGQIRMISNPVQDLKHMDDPLEPIKVASALRSECMVMEYRKKNKPKEVSILDYTAIAALFRQVPTTPDTKEETPGVRYCPTCGAELADTEPEYCYKCGQRIFWQAGDPE